jgi:signal transduction histidine kinase
VKERTDTRVSPAPGFPAAYYCSLLAGLVHKANNILTVLTGHSGLLLLEPTLSEETLQPIRRISRAAETLSRYLDQANAVSRATVLVLEPIVFSDFLKALTPPSGLNIQNKCDDKVRILGDRRKLQETVEEILRNAVEANATTEIVTAIQEPRIVRLDFRDDGHGIKEAVLPKIFDPFFTTRLRQEQFGLGLFRVRGELARMNADVAAASDGKTYTEISIRIPSGSAV